MPSSFSSQVKDELARIEIDNADCRRAELEALVRTTGTLYLKGRGELELTLSTLHAGCARRTFRLLRDGYGVRSQLLVRKRQRLKRENVYVTRLSDQAVLRRLVEDLHIIEGSELSYRASEIHVEHPECRSAYLRGCFLGAGSISDPEGQHHLELTFETRSLAVDIIELLAQHDINGSMTRRGSRWVVYVKEAEAIVDFLRLTGAHNAVFAYEDVRIYKELRNRVNRLVNAETANVTKIVNAAQQQIEAIHTVARHMGMDRLRPTLREVARARLQYPELSLRDLGRQLDPPIGKSAVSYRMRRLQQLADQLRGQADGADE